MDKLETRDERGVRRQVYKRDKGLIPIDGNETEALISVMRQQFLPGASGRPPKYENLADFKDKVVEYFDYISSSNKEGAKLIPDIEGFCCFAGICRDTLNNWEHERNAEYVDVIHGFKNAVASFKKQLALKGKIPAIVFATDFNNNHGYTQKQEINITASNILGDQLTPDEIARRVVVDEPVDVKWKEVK